MAVNKDESLCQRVELSIACNIIHVYTSVKNWPVRPVIEEMVS